MITFLEQKRIQLQYMYFEIYVIDNSVVYINYQFFNWIIMKKTNNYIITFSSIYIFRSNLKIT